MIVVINRLHILEARLAESEYLREEVHRDVTEQRSYECDHQIVGFERVQNVVFFLHYEWRHGWMVVDSTYEDSDHELQEEDRESHMSRQQDAGDVNEI